MTTRDAPTKEQVAEAIKTLVDAGIPLILFDREMVGEMLDRLEYDGKELADKEAIIEHVTEGDDWWHIDTRALDSAEYAVWEVIKGTAHDHMEWFGTALENLG